MSSSNSLTITLLNQVILQLNRYLGLFVLLFGTIGNTLNVLVLSQRSLRSNSCAWLFLTSSIANQIALVAGLLSRILSTWALDLTGSVGWLCKVRAFVMFDSRTVAFWLIVLASMDRWFSSSRNAHHRRKCTLKNSQKGLLIILLISTVVYIHLIYCYDANQINAPIKCYGITNICRLYSDLSLAFITILIPLLLMITFGTLTILNVRCTQNRIQPASSTMTRQPSKKNDRQLIVMLLVQIGLLGVLTIPLLIQRLYITVTSNVMKSNLQNTIDNFIYNLTFLLYCMANAIPFYIYTLTGGNVFRNALFSLTQAFICRRTLHV